MYSLHRIRPGYWIVRNMYGEPVAECDSHSQALIMRGRLEHGMPAGNPSPMHESPIHDPWGLSRLA